MSQPTSHAVWSIKAIDSAVLGHKPVPTSRLVERNPGNGAGGSGAP